MRELQVQLLLIGCVACVFRISLWLFVAVTDVAETVFKFGLRVDWW